MKRYKIVALFLFLGFFATVCADKKTDEVSKEYKQFLELNEKGILNSVISLLGGALSVAEDAAYTMLTPVQELIKENTPAIYENPYRNLNAHVRFGEPIGQAELWYRDKRFPRVKAAQEEMLDMNLEYEDVLEIGFSCSGGGWRAMCCAIGSCVGAQKIGLLDTAMYITSLSGSTWFLGPWMYSGMDIYDYKERAIEIASHGIKPQSVGETADLLDNVWVKFAHNQPLNMIDLYGALLGNSLLRGLAIDPHRVYMTDQRSVIADGEVPLPVYTAVLGERDKDEFWFEFTPYEIGSRWLSSYVPTWAFGRHFKRGTSKSSAPEQNLGFFMGIFGSAFAADFEDAYEIIVSGITFPNFLRHIPFAETVFKAIKKVFAKLAYTDIGDLRVAWGRVPNYVYKLKGVPHNDYKDLKLVDGGLDCNNPVFAAYRRPPYGDAPDIIFVFDAGQPLKFKELQVLVEYAEYNGLKFPQIEKYEIDKQIIAVFKDDTDLDVPVIVYMPAVNGMGLIQKNSYKEKYNYYLDLLDGFDIEKASASGFAHTFNFNYTEREAETLMAMTEFNILAVEEKIKEIMKERIHAKRKFRNKKEK